MTKTHTKLPNGAVIYDGPSRIDGNPIIAVLVFKSDNGKTGNMGQVHIIRSDMHPIEILKQNEDGSICGDCPLRYVLNPKTGKLERICYVNVGFGPAQVYKQFKLGNYPHMTPELAGAILREMKRGVRLGAYGDPAAVDVDIWVRLLESCGTFHTAYTHQWREPFFQPELLKYAMASIDDINTVEILQELYPDARWYRLLKSESDELRPNEIICPSKDVNGKRRVQCKDCKLCAGTSLRARNIAILENA
jgi:hypothetical protein